MKRMKCTEEYAKNIILLMTGCLIDEHRFAVIAETNQY